MGLNAEADSNFNDVRKEDYYYEAVAIAKKLGITNGTDGNKFSPDEKIKRQDMMVMIDNALKTAGKTLPAGSASLADFTDASQIASYAKGSVENLVESGIIQGDGNRINPSNNLTRAEAAVIIYRIYNIQ